MISEARDFEAESAALRDLLTPLDEADFDTPTQFKGWSINDVLQHLHVWNVAAALSASDGTALGEMIGRMRSAESLRAFERGFLNDVRGAALFELWNAGVVRTAETFAQLDPKQRLPWIGPTMSARSSITARQMETWAHGQEIYDLLGVERVNHDRLKNIAHLGVTTFGWSYAVRGRVAPEKAPFVELRAPSGAVWSWGEPSGEDSIRGDAVDFCQVVTQTRNVADTKLDVAGPVAREWMSFAQCFAGAAREPPVPGVRYMQRR